MPSEGVELSPQGKILTNDEVIRLAKLFVQSGVTKIRLTGGEPTVRKGIGEIICKSPCTRKRQRHLDFWLARLNDLREFGLQSIAMTSNGLALHRTLPQFIENGLSHLNLRFFAFYFGTQGIVLIETSDAAWTASTPLNSRL